jgi:hypothetical protein
MAEDIYTIVFRATVENKSLPVLKEYLKIYGEQAAERLSANLTGYGINVTGVGVPTIEGEE